MARRLLLALTALCALPAAGAAQAGSCVLQENRYVNRQDAGGFGIYAVAGPLLVECQGGTTLRADSAMVYEASNEVQLFGNVDYRDPTRTLVSNYATYNSVIGRLYATGNVVFTDVTRGSTLRGPELEYYRAMQGRPQAQVIAGQRPHLTIVPAGNGGNREPLEVDGDRVTAVGENNFSASGNVVVRRSDLNATAAEAQHDAVAQTLRLRGNAQIRGERFDLAGETVDATLPQNRLERVVARRDAEMVSEKLRVEGPEIHLFIRDDLLQRMVTRGGAEGTPGGGGRPFLAATGLRLEADSVEAVLPGQVLERVVAVGRAHAETVDTAGQPPPATGPRARLPAQERPAAPAVARDRDWVLGDTIVGYFAPKDSAAAAPARAAADTARAPEEEVELDRVVAKGAARSFYRVREEEGEPVPERPAMNYLVGEEIELTLEDGELDVAEVKGLQRGVYLDPNPPGTAAPPPAGEAGTRPQGAATPPAAPAGRRP